MSLVIALLLIPGFLLVLVALGGLLVLLERLVPGLTAWLDEHVEPTLDKGF